MATAFLRSEMILLFLSAEDREEPNEATRCHGRSSGCGTSRWEHAGCRPEGPCPSSPSESSVPSRSRRRWESSRRADVHRVFLEDLVHGFGWRLRRYLLSVPTTHGRTLAVHLDLDRMPLGVIAFTKSRVLLQDVFGILVGHQAHGHLRRGLGRNHCLGAVGDEAAGHAVDFKRRTRPCAIQHGIAGLAGQDVDPTSVLR